MASSAILTVKILTDASKASAGMDQAAGKVSKLRSGVGKLAVPAAIAGAAIVTFGKKAFDAASETQQAMGAVDTVFGRNAAKVKSWAQGAADSTGLAADQYANLAALIGSQLKNTGIPMDKVAGKTKDLIGLGADLAATYGGTTADAVGALSSALKGETDPIERYGISIKQANVQAEMAAEGTDKLTGAAQKQAQTTATLSLVHKQAGKAVGQFARESDSAAGSAQIAEANWRNTQATLGQALLPVVAMVAQWLGKLAGILGRNATATKIVIAIIAGLVIGIYALIAAFKVYDLILRVTKIQAIATWAATLGPIALVIAGVALVVGVFVLLYKKSATFRKLVDKVWSTIKSGARAVASVVKAVVGGAWEHISSLAKTFGKAAAAVFNAIKAVVRVVFTAIKAYVTTYITIVKTIIRGVLTVARAVFNPIKTLVRGVMTAVKSTISGAVDRVTDTWDGLTKLLSGPFDALTTAVDHVIDAIDSLIGWIAKIHLPDVGGWLSKLPGVSHILPGSAAVPTSAAVPLGRAGVAGRAGIGGSRTAGPTIIVQGALDPDAVARQIRALLTGHDRRVGLVPRSI